MQVTYDLERSGRAGEDQNSGVAAPDRGQISSNTEQQTGRTARQIERSNQLGVDNRREVS